MATPEKIVEKYQDIIAEEVNVKQVTLLDADQSVTVQYVPLGNMLGEAFGKDTWRIIASAKKWQAQLNDAGELLVQDGDDSWTLSQEMFDLRYSWFDEANQIVEEATMIQLDLELNDTLIQEWIAREISRFLNQMRKDADYQVSDRVQCGFTTESDYLSGIVATHESYLQAEALLQSINRESIAWDHTAEFEIDGQSMSFTLKK